MQRTVAAAMLAAFSLSATAQDFIHYKFDSTCSNEVVNYATGPQALASNGTLQSTSAGSPWTTGMFGGALAAGTAVAPAYYNKVLTGWDPSTQNITGSLTMAWFMRHGATSGSASLYLMGAPSGGFRLFTNGIAGRGLYQRIILAGGGNGTNSTIANDFYLPAATADIQTLAAANWVHVAMVIDATAQTATWYVAGQPVLTLNNVPGALITAAGPFQVGYYSSASEYDLDEFLMSLRAYTPAEILALSLAPQAGDGDYSSGIGSQCAGVGLGSTGGRPTIGNVLYGLNVNTAANAIWSLQFGFNRCSLGGVLPLPLDIGTLAPAGAGCWLLTDMVGSAGGITGGAPVAVALPILPIPSFSGMNLYSQAFTIDLGTQAIAASNGFAISVGN